MSNKSCKFSIRFIQSCFLALVALLISVNGAAIGGRSEVTVRLFGDEKQVLLPSLDDVVSETPSDTWKTFMRSHDGRRFECHKSANDVKIFEHKPMCILSPYDYREYWQVEVCIGGNVSQVHMENGRVQSRVILGNFESSKDLTHYYEGGSSGRSAKVIFSCDKDAARPHITRTEEPKPLIYEISVATKSACDIEHAVSIESLPCVERVLGNIHVRVCPRKSVTIVQDGNTEGKVAKQSQFAIPADMKEGLNARQYEVYNSTEKCSTADDEIIQSKVTYICSMKQRWPVILSADRIQCTFFVRVAVSSVCETMPMPIDCHLILP